MTHSSGNTPPSPSPSRPPRTHAAKAPLLAVVFVIVALLAIGIVPRITQKHALASEVRAATDTVVPVSVGKATRAKGGPISLPGTVQALHESIVYARSAGYVRRWYVDIGQHVRAGQLLADIESPELDQEVQQARATLKQATASLELARSDLERWRALDRDSAVSRQELDQKVAAYDVGTATVNAQRANLERLTSLQAYERITAPFTGTVTQRNLDVGTLVAPGAGGTSGGTPAGSSGQGLFRVAQTDTMRVYINVPQALAPAMHPGLKANVTLQERRDHVFGGTVVRTADALDPATRTLLVEVQVPNPDRMLLSGSYAQVEIDPGATVLPVTVPANALLVDANGTRVATLDANNVIHYHPVEIGRDYGAVVEILSGIEAEATIVLNPSDDLHDGTTVKPVRLTDADTKPTARASAGRGGSR